MVSTKVDSRETNKLFTNEVSDLLVSEEVNWSKEANIPLM